MKTVAVIGSVIEDALHRKVFYALLALGLILLLLIPLLPSADVGVQMDLFREASLGLVSIVVFLLAVILASTILPREREKRILYNVLSKPLSRREYYLGKYLGVLTVVGAALLAVFPVILVFLYAKFGVFNPGMAKAFFTMWLEAALLAAVSMAASVYLSPFPCVLIAGLFYVVGHVKGEFLYRAMTDAAHNPLLRAAAGMLYYLLPNLERFNINETVAHGERVFHVGALELLLLFLTAAAFAALLVWLGMFLLGGRDL